VEERLSLGMVWWCCKEEGGRASIEGQGGVVGGDKRTKE